MAGGTVRLTVAQALVRFLSAQYTERGGGEQRLIEGVFGILGHGNVAGIGQALLEAELEDPHRLRFVPARNEQGMVHAASAFARMRNRMSTWACTSSIGPGATNMVTGAALATINRLPVLLLPSDVFATRVADPVLQQLEHPTGLDITVNDAFRPVSRFFDRVWRPEQLPSALLGAMRVLSDPVETGAVTVALPQDVQAEAHDWPRELFDRRVWHVPRPRPDREAIRRAADVIRSGRRPLIVAGGGVVYSEASSALHELADTTGMPVAETQAGKGSLPHTHPAAVGAVGVTGTSAANRLARDADVVIGVGTRFTDFTTASRTAFQHPEVQFVNVNVTRADTAKHAAMMVVADAREALTALTDALAGWSVSDDLRERTAELRREWDETVDRAHALGHDPLPAQSEVIGAVNEAAGADGVVVCAAGSMPGDLHKQWRASGPQDYHVEYGYSCMGYEIAGGMGARMACPDREVFVLVGDGSYLMLAQELVTAVQEGVKLIVVLVENHGYASIGALSESVGSQRLGTSYRHRGAKSARLDGGLLPIDLAANAESLGARVLRARGVSDLREALAEARRSTEPRPIVIHVETDPSVAGPDGQSWWDVPVAETSALATTQAARRTYEQGKATQRPLL